MIRTTQQRSECYNLNREEGPETEPPIDQLLVGYGTLYKLYYSSTHNSVSIIPHKNITLCLKVYFLNESGVLPPCSPTGQ